MKNQSLYINILDNIGGKENISDVAHCMTRLRIALKDTKKVNLEALNNLEGSMGAVLKGNQVQIIIGNNIAQTYNQFTEFIQFDENAVQNSSAKTKGNLLEKGLNNLASIFNPVVPALAGSGMLKAFLVIFRLTGILSDQSETYFILNTVSDAVFYFLPILLAYSASKVFKCNTFVAVALAGALMHPGFTNLMAEGTTQLSFIGLPINLMSYASSVLPAVFGVWFLSYVERFFNKFVPNAFKIVFVPAFTLLIAVPITLMVVGPVATYISNYISGGIEFLVERGGILAGIIYGGLQSTIVVAGLQHGILPLQIDAIARTGYNLYSPISGNNNVAQAGASFGVWLKSKNIRNKSVAASASISALLGISEPAVYGVTLRLKRPFLAAAIGAATGGAIAGGFGAQAYAIGGPSFVTLPMFISDTNPYNVIVVAGAFTVSFIVAAILTCILGFEEIIDDHKSERKEELGVVGDEWIELASPVEGKVVPIEEVNDQVFSSKSIGNGVAIEPSSNKVYAPASGVVELVFKTQHAIGIKTNEGVEILIHLGIDTVRLDGKYFNTMVKEGDTIERGDLIGEYDYIKIREEGFAATAIMVVTNSKTFPEHFISDTVNTSRAEPIMKINIERGTN
ncbi:PTS system, beta-glucosides-specific IIC component [Amphibacillus marinus]|uniref:PTS system, beta-glucosides-specific IIC component n=1 Tax=Amphibacillus marinus TaxID=872970 RepID=A0A1H8TAW0_9BACI|nr:beta-glucoside-specific PTS transporter subunit IIABC [Amphibacillus marinus]SEO88011.1 PTS system, beta-glucosides-specific IIC component [Amphibacillus marinus]